MKRIKFTVHASSMLEMRCGQFGLNAEEGKRRCIETILFGRCERKNTKKIYYKYYNDNLLFYLICKENSYFIRVFTIIIKTGRM